MQKSKSKSALLDKSTSKSILRDKLLFTLIILLIYLTGKNIPLFKLDLLAYNDRAVDVGSLLMQALNGDAYRRSIFALGISPYMFSTFIVQMLVACLNSEIKARFSPKRTNRLTLSLMLVFAVVQAIMFANGMKLTVTGSAATLARIVNALEMVTGAMIILLLAERNKKYGLGGQTPLILTNILTGVITIFTQLRGWDILFGAVIAFLVTLSMTFFENTEKRIPLQRISIHNIYADTNYLAIKLDPVGVMPVMFSTIFFMIPQLIVSILHRILPGNGALQWWFEEMTLNSPLGVIVYVVIFYILSILFARIFLNPTDMTEQFLKSGDCIEDIHAGNDTKRYLIRSLNRMSIAGATMFAVCLCLPLLLKSLGLISSQLSAIPSSVIILAGVFLSLYREGEALRSMDSYKRFI